MDIKKKPNGKSLDDPRRQIEESFKLDPTVTVTLGDKKYLLEFDNTAAKEIFKAIAYNMLSDPDIVARLNDPNSVGVILYWGLKRHHPEITEEEADRLLTAKHRLYITSTLIQAMTGFVPDLATGDDKESPAEAVKDPTQPLVPSG